MRKLFICLVFGLFISSCDLGQFDETEGIESSYLPVLMTRSDLENSIRAGDPRPLKKPGKIYFYQQYLFISEQYKGVHIIDNSDPSNPVNTKFIQVPGCMDMAVKGSVLFVDNATDLVSISIQDLNNIKVLNRIPHSFPELVPPDMVTVPDRFNAHNRPENTVIVEWTKK